MLSGSDDKTAQLWDIKTGRCLRVLEGHTGGVHSVVWSIDKRCALYVCATVTFAAPVTLAAGLTGPVATV